MEDFVRVKDITIINGCGVERDLNDASIISDNNMMRFLQHA